jgi:hypothetical protein
VDGAEDQYIEVAGGGFNFTDMTYYNSWTESGYTVDEVEVSTDEYDLILTGPGALDGVDGGEKSGSLWLFNDGTTPLPSASLKYLLSNSAVTKQDFIGRECYSQTSIFPITSPFDPSLISSLDDLLNLISPQPNVILIFGYRMDVNAGTKNSSMVGMNYFREADYEGPAYGWAIVVYDGRFNVDASGDIEVLINNKNLKVVK